MTLNDKPVNPEAMFRGAFANFKPATPEQIAASEADRARQEAERRQDRLETEGRIPKRHLDCAPGTDGPWRAKFEALTKLIGTGCTVVLTGERGTGKTQMAVELVKYAFLTKRTDGLYRTATDFLVRVKSTFRRDSAKSELDVLREHQGPAVLVLDEIGRRQESEWENNILFELLNSRYADMKDTILTCNLPRAEMEANLGASILSRMLESGGTVECNWPSFRH